MPSKSNHNLANIVVVDYAKIYNPSQKLKGNISNTWINIIQDHKDSQQNSSKILPHDQPHPIYGKYLYVKEMITSESQ